MIRSVYDSNTRSYSAEAAGRNGRCDDAAPDDRGRPPEGKKWLATLPIRCTLAAIV
jgi:hypothetical protein